MSNSSGLTRSLLPTALAVALSLGLVRLAAASTSFAASTGVDALQSASLNIESLILAIALGIGLLAGSLLLLNRRLHAKFEERTQALRRSKDSVRQVIDLVPDLVYALDKTGAFILYNRAVAESLEVPINKLKGRLLAHVHAHPQEVAQILEDVQAVLDTGIPKVSLEESFTDRKGRVRWLQTTRLPYTSLDGNTTAVLTMAADITSRRQYLSALRANEEKFRAIFNQTFQFTAILDLNGTLMEANDAFLASMNVGQVKPGIPFWNTPWWANDFELQMRVEEAVAHAAAGETVRFEAHHSLTDGSMVHTDFSLKPARDDNGNIIFLLAEERDISSLKQAEENLLQLNEDLENRVVERTLHLEAAKRALEESLQSLKNTQKELISSEKMAALGGLVAGVAHEINTPLGIGVTASSFLDEQIRTLDHKYQTNTLRKSDLELFLETAKDSSSNIVTNLTRGAELIRSFKQVSADQSSQQQRIFNVKRYLDEVLLSLSPKLKNTPYTVENRCDKALEIYSYPGAFMHIITNLLLNTIDHGFDGRDFGRVTIDGALDHGEFVLVFQDDGKGLLPDQLDKIFQPFYTTKQGSGGTGLGLHIVLNIVTRTLGGTIRCESEPGKGTSFIIRVPATVETHKA